MARHCAEAVPAWKGSDLDDETGESAPLFDVGINRFRELLKVGLFKLGLRSHIQNRMRLVECVFDHLRLLQCETCCNWTRLLTSSQS